MSDRVLVMRRGTLERRARARRRQRRSHPGSGRGSRAPVRRGPPCTRCRPIRVEAALGLVILALARSAGRGGAEVLRAREPRRPRPREPAGAHRRDRRDARDPRPARSTSRSDPRSRCAASLPGRSRRGRADARVVAWSRSRIGAAIGAVNGLLVAWLHIPSIVVTLAAMVALRDGLRWITEGAWVQNLPASFQWFGLTQQAYPVVAVGIAVLLCVLTAWTLRSTRAGRVVFATGSNAEAARLAAIDTAAVRVSRVRRSPACSRRSPRSSTRCDSRRCRRTPVWASR